MQFTRKAMHDLKLKLRKANIEEVTSALYRTIIVLLDSYSCHLKYLRRHTLLSLLCCSPIPDHPVMRKVRQAVVLEFESSHTFDKRDL